ncbi:MAG: stage II sporulation protein M [Pygmaiobacter sp.]
MKRKSSLIRAELPMILAWFYCAGLVIGTLYVNAQLKSENGYLAYYINSYLEDHFSGNFLSVFSISFLSVIMTHTLLLLLSLSCFSAPVICLIPLFKGFVYGTISATLYMSYGLKGIIANVLLLWIPVVVQSITLILFCGESLTTSARLFRSALLHHSVHNAISVSKEFSRYVLYSTIGLSVAVLEGVFSMLLGSVF